MTSGIDFSCRAAGGGFPALGLAFFFFLSLILMCSILIIGWDGVGGPGRTRTRYLDRFFSRCNVRFEGVGVGLDGR